MISNPELPAGPRTGRKHASVHVEESKGSSPLAGITKLKREVL